MNLRLLGVLLTTGSLLIAAQQPNVVIILADDMGSDSVSVYNAKLGLETPYLDKLASESMRFTDAHSSSAVCSPTRYGILTGRYNWRSTLKRGIVGPKQANDAAVNGIWWSGLPWPKQ